MTGDLAVWLRAQLDADEQTARAATPGPWQFGGRGVAAAFRPIAVTDAESQDAMSSPVAGWLDALKEDRRNGEHIARHDPAFTLADITAKRTIIDLHRPAWVVGFAGKGPPFCDLCGRRYACGPVPASLTPEESETMDYPCTTLRLLAQPYAGRPGWHNEWTTT